MAGAAAGKKGAEETAPNLSVRLAAAREQVKERGPSYGQNSFLVGLLLRELESHEIEGYTEELRETLRTFSGASAMISILLEKFPDMKREDRAVAA